MIPKTAYMPPVIPNFQGPYAFLSNFWVEPDGSCVEGEYQAEKHAGPAERCRLLEIWPYQPPGRVKRAGRCIPMRPDWDLVKDDLMLHYVWRKFADHKSLCQALQATGTAELQEGNHWRDQYWGMVNGVGQNRLGLILMHVREGL